MFRKATTPEILTWLMLMPGGGEDNLADNVAEALVIENYITDSPGYAGPVGIIVWSGSPQWLTTFEKAFNDENPSDLRWVKGVDTVQMLEGDQRGFFDGLNEFLAERADGGDGEFPHDIFTLIADKDETSTEFWETGSVTIKVDGREFVLTLNVREMI